MELEHHIKQSLNRYTETLKPPAALDRAVYQSIQQRHISAKKRNLTIKRLGLAVLIAVFSLTITAFSNPEFADRIYGSYDIVKKKVVTLSLQQYQQIGFKFMGAQKQLGTDFPAFEKLSKQLVAAKINFSDSNQNIDYDTLTAEKRAELKQLLSDIQPFFDRLNHQPTAKNVLTADEYDTLIEAQMKLESMMAKGKVNPSAGRVKTEDLPPEYRGPYEKSQQLIESLENKVRQSVKTVAP